MKEKNNNKAAHGNYVLETLLKILLLCEIDSRLNNVLMFQFIVKYALNVLITNKNEYSHAIIYNLYALQALLIKKKVNHFLSSAGL